MSIIAILLISTILFVNAKIYKNILAPAVITNIVWLLLLIIYNTVDHGLRPLSDYFYWIVLIWNLGFTIGSCLINKLYLPVHGSMTMLNRHRIGSILLWVMILSLLLSIYGLYLIGSSLNPGNIFAGIRQNSVSILNGEEPSVILPIYISMAQSIASYSVVVIGTLFFFRGNKSFAVKIALSLIILYTLFRSNKLSVVQVLFFISTLVILKNNISKKMIFYFLIAFLIMMLGAHLMRAGGDKAAEFDLGKMLAVYLLSPLPAFDIVSTSNTVLIEDFNGEYTFRAFIPYLNLLGFNLVGNSDPFNLHFWTNTPLPVNVYTVFFSFHTDFGIYGIVFASLFYGIFFGILWKGCKKKIPMFQVAYASCFYILAFQFFADYLFMFFWTNALTLLFIFFFFTHFSFGHLLSAKKYRYA